MKCDMCKNEVNDGVQCAGCKRNLDYSCAGISETGYRKLGPERRAVWKCPQCKLLRTYPEEKSITDAIHTTRILMEAHRNDKKVLYMVFIDL
ncbi:unnamed protein product [Leptidea sinapis]|uniref:PHD-type domain-containing protein n=1 Tax=Leptidea sinapis TaxID=189913 RepID=A0A5E4QIZ4_9NEOP|nr:unnamed protein product [Leptidea sinapis]